MNIPDHPDIARALAYGTPEGEETFCKKCDYCGCKIYDGETYFIVDEEIYCRDCMYEQFAHTARDTF